MDCKKCKTSIKPTKTELFDLLREGIRTLLDDNKLKTYTQFASPVEFEKWLKSIIKRRHIFTQEDLAYANRLASELYWSYGDLQLGMQHILWIKDVRGVSKGFSEEQKNKIELPDNSVPDFLFWYYIGISWEMIYRVWNRIANILNYIIFDIKDPRTTKVKYYNVILGKAKEGKIDIAKNIYFNFLYSNIDSYNRISKKRNKISHNESSIFSRLKIEMEVSELYNISQKMPYFKAKVSMDDPSEEVEELKKEYSLIYDITENTIKFIDSFVEKKRIVTI